MKVTELPSRCLQWLGIALATLAASSIAKAQLTPIWTVNYGQTMPGVAQGLYFSNLSVVGSVVFSADTPTINFDWGFGSPAASVPVDRFSASWTGTIIPKASETYTFYATSDDGVRIWLDGQLILDNWVVQSATEAASISIHLTAGSLYHLRVEYFESTAPALIRVYWKGVSQPKQLVTFKDGPDGSWANFGAALTGFGDGRFAVAAPRDELRWNTYPHPHDGGFAWFYNQSGQSTNFPTAPTNTLRREYGRALAGFPDGRVLVGTANAATGPSSHHVRGFRFLHGPGGEVWVNGRTPMEPRIRARGLGKPWQLFRAIGLPQLAERTRQSLHLRRVAACASAGRYYQSRVRNFGTALAARSATTDCSSRIRMTAGAGRSGSVRISIYPKPDSTIAPCRARQQWLAKHGSRG
jgi:hypothetical protein